ncbi:Fucose permease [Streptomyces sp. WMMB 714]|uniref:MFS transporter n=1 Tax=Streptomyces sp. WMMB 714 TaxID=1286822 RepID=UPI000823E3DB|nr:MFS transporter [Streptomyces sp. WMMB 714]SCK12171.1 Fucose permease [Streptomyces sp. WMMB 714]
MPRREVNAGARPPARLRRARAAVSAIFFVHGAVFASWAARVPAVKDELHLSAGVLGLVLAGPGLGALAGSQLGGAMVDRFGGRAVSASAPVVLCAPLGLVPAADSAWPLLCLLAVLGAADGCTSVAMNAQAVVVQERYGRTVLNSLHAIRSIGAVAGGLAGAATALLGLTLAAQFALTAVALAAVSAVAAGGLLPEAEAGRRQAGAQAVGEERIADEPVAGQAQAASSAGRAEARAGAPVGQGAQGRKTVLLLAVMVFLAALVSDAPASWSGVYLRHVGADAATAAAGYAAFSAGEVCTRLFNDRLVNRFGWVRLIRSGTLGCATVLAAALMAGHPAAAMAAFVAAGAGISAVFPGAFTAAGSLPRPGPAMGHLGFAGNAGWLAVSPLVGGLATLVGLPAALGVLVVAALAIAALAPVTRPKATGGAGAPLLSAREEKREGKEPR